MFLSIFEGFGLNYKPIPQSAKPLGDKSKDIAGQLGKADVKNKNDNQKTATSKKTSSK